MKPGTTFGNYTKRRAPGSGGFGRVHAANARPPAPPPKNKAPARSNPAGGGSGGYPPPQRPSSLLWPLLGALALVVVLSLVLSSLREPSSAPPPGDEAAGIADASQQTGGESNDARADAPRADAATSTAAAVPQVAGDTGDPAPAASAQQPPPAQATTARITRDVVTRSGPGLDFPAAGGGLAGGDVVAVLGRDAGGNWYLVGATTGEAWVPQAFVEPVSGSLAAVRVIGDPAQAAHRPTSTRPAVLPAAPPPANATPIATTGSNVPPPPVRPTETAEPGPYPPPDTPDPYPPPDTPEPPPLDSDGDGVPDDQDQCPHQSAGANPDPNRPGCPGSDPYPYPYP